MKSTLVPNQILLSNQDGVIAGLMSMKNFLQPCLYRVLVLSSFKFVSLFSNLFEGAGGGEGGVQAKAYTVLTL